MSARLFHTADCMPSRPMPQGQNGLSQTVLDQGTIRTMPKQAKSVVSDPAMSEIQRQTGERIRAIRELAGLNQGDIAVACGADQSQWSRWERGIRMAEIVVMLRFARRAQVSLDLIYRGIPSGTNPALARLLQEAVPHLLAPDPTRTGSDRDTALASYRSAIHRDAAA